MRDDYLDDKHLAKLRPTGGRMRPFPAWPSCATRWTCPPPHPQPSSQEEPETLTLDDYLIDDPNRTSLHKVRGDSMRDAGILESDLVVVEHHTPTKPGTSS